MGASGKARCWAVSPAAPFNWETKCEVHVRGAGRSSPLLLDHLLRPAQRQHRDSARLARAPFSTRPCPWSLPARAPRPAESTRRCHLRARLMQVPIRKPLCARAPHPRFEGQRRRRPETAFLSQGAACNTPYRLHRCFNIPPVAHASHSPTRAALATRGITAQARSRRPGPARASRSGGPSRAGARPARGAPRRAARRPA
jgi:hypothetical protein